MDNAVALVETYLRVNGYFTVTEYPVVVPAEHHTFRTATDLDILAFRFPHAGNLLPPDRKTPPFEVDPALGAHRSVADMIIGEVKEGRGVLNEAARSRAVLEAALVRFGCCSPQDAAANVAKLVHEGRTSLPVGHDVRLVVFASAFEGHSPVAHTVTLAHVVRFLQDYLRVHWEVLHTTEFKDPVFGFLAMLEKALRVAAPEPIVPPSS